MKKVEGIKNKNKIIFNIRGVYKIGALNRNELIKKLLATGAIEEWGLPDDLIVKKMMRSRPFSTCPVEREVILVSANFKELGITKNTTYQSVIENALGALLVYEGKKYIVSECAAEIGPHFCLQYKPVNPKSFGNEEAIVMNQNIIVKGASCSFMIIKVGDNNTEMTWFTPNYRLNQWPPYTQFVFCLTEK